MKAKYNFMPLYKKGDKFRVIRINKDPGMMKIEAIRIKDNKIYGFDEEELE